ncbi:RHS repeat-associated core domain-containing protein [Sorangium sp. So ce233]|uniref:RHS repeat-associated core domain-containing protein n=1 Tax=Sorangium sp. So ce233 TaxID=3133290 RepID=UPI003F611B01
MARTAPVPNIPAIPGMNPGVFVMGGGGNGGGSRKGKGNGNGDGQGGNGDNGGDGADGGGKGAGACGQGQNGGCTNCGHSIARGDPVDVSTGRVFTIPKTDLFLPGLFNLSVIRAYSSDRRDVDVGIGFGWTHGLAWTLEERRASVVVRTGDGKRVELPRPAEPGEEARLGPWGVFRDEEGYAIRPGNEFVHFFRPVEPGSKVHLLASIAYRRRGRISLQYERGRLARVIDSVGRVVVFHGNAGGRIDSISVPDPQGRTLVFARYAYDDQGNMVAAADADGHTTRFAYDDDHRLTRLEYPNGLVFHFAYDGGGRCVETWGAYPNGHDPALAGGLPDVLRDGRTRARGIYHCRFEYDGDYTEVVDSARLQRFFVGPGDKIEKAVDARGGVTSRTFDSLGRVTSQTDPTEATWLYKYDELDEIVAEVNPEGHQTTVRRDGAGRSIELVDPAGGAVTITRNTAGEIEAITDQNGATTHFALDARSLVAEIVDPRGARRTYEHDAHGNLLAHTTATGGRFTFTYDHWGRRLSERDPLGNMRWYRYSSSGRITGIVDGLGRTTTREYDAMGNLIREVYPDGTSECAEYGGLNWLCRIVRPDRTEVRVLYNREGWPLLVQNEAGEEHQFEYGPSGLVVAERDFLGRETRYGHDRLGRVIWIDEGDGKRELTLNRIGQIVKEEAPDGSTRTYDYNARGELELASSNGVAFTWRRDATGRILQEELQIGGATYVVTSARDRAGNRDGVQTSLGHALRMRRDAAGAVTELWTKDERVVAIQRDPLGMAVRRDLSGGGAVLLSYDAERRLRGQRIVGPADPQPTTGIGEPAWVGRSPPGALERRFDYTPVDEICKVTSSDGEDIEYTYDTRRHVVRQTAGGASLSFQVDANASYHESGPTAPHRAYGRGGQLLGRGELSYVYDGRGRLVERRRAALGASPPEVTRFEWDAWSLLRAVVQPDGTRVEFDYDAFARRVAKRTLRDGQVVEQHHYVWDLLSMVHDVKVDRAGRSEEALTYLFDENDGLPPAGHREDGGWVHYVTDVNGAPLDLVNPSGRRVGKVERTLFGRARVTRGSAATPFRFLGQVEDPETGLHYNRYRYYDPDTGRYISPDPTLLQGGLHLYAYGPNPVAWVDPMGWTHFTTVTGFPSGSATHATNKSPVQYDSMYSKNCPTELSHSGAQLCHSEQKWCYDLLASGKKGGNYNLSGSLPPCPNCHGAMMRTAQETGSKINYDWGNGNSITYDGQTNPGSVGLQFSQGASAQHLREGGYANYSLTPSFSPQAGQVYTDPSAYWGVNKPAGVHKTYTQAKSK